SFGTISNLRRRAPGNLNEMERSKITLHHYGTLIQTDGRISLGCSGGALVGLDGKVFGLTTVLAGIPGSDSPGAQAIPLDADTRRIVEVLKRGEEVEYGFFGVVLTDRRVWNGRGARIARTAPGSPAEAAGVWPGDVVVSINGKAVKDND